MAILRLHEIQESKRKKILINYQRLTELLGFNTYDEVKTYRKKWVEYYLENGKNTRDDKWTMSIAACPVKFLSLFNRGWK